ncbi:MAG: type II toxin-antitoxin system HipA family toxin [Sphingomicrobium sp.]
MARDGCFVWIWLPKASEPVVAGRLERDAGRDVPAKRLRFNYGRSYLDRADAIALEARELPLRAGPFEPRAPMIMPSAIRDASPDSWGRRVILHQRTGAPTDPDELDFLMESGSDRIGALDFQASATAYRPRDQGNAELEELMTASDRVERGVPLTPALELALRHGTAIGGARPKALIDGPERKWIAKFSASNDISDVIRAEYVAMRLAARCGLDVARVELREALGKQVLLIERFDRVRAGDGRWQRRAMESALTLLALDEMEARYASYEALAEVIRHRFAEPRATLRELFGRMVFNILAGNTDDHARNHAALWDGEALRLTPAYDLCPQARTGRQAGQAMRIAGDRNDSRVALCVEAAAAFQLKEAEARGIIRDQISAIRGAWDEVCDEAGMTPADRQGLWGRQFLNPYAFEGWVEPG